MIAALRHRNFAFLWSASVLSSLGNWVLFAALPFYVYQETGSALATGAMFMVNTIPRIVFGSLAGVLVDRWNRKYTLIVADLLRAAVLLLYFVIHFPGWFWLLYVIAFVETTISVFFGPAAGALLPHLVRKEQLVAANALNNLNTNFSRLIGPALGGVLLALVGLQGAVLVDVISYLVSALLLMGIRLPPTAREVQQTAPSVALSYGSFWREWLAGLALIRCEQWLRIFFASLGFAMIAQGVLNVLLVVFVSEILNGDARVFGLLVSVQGVGGVIGSVVIGHWSRAIQPGQMFASSLLLIAVLFLLFVNIPQLFLALLLLGLMGIPVVGWMTSMSVLLQSGIPDAYRGRIFATMGTGQSLLMLGGMAMASGLHDLLGVVTLLNLAGGCFVLASGLGVWLNTVVTTPDSLAATGSTIDSGPS